MPIIDLSAQPLIQLLVHRLRDASQSGARLRDAHRQLGAQLAREAAADLPLVSRCFIHPTGSRPDGCFIDTDSQPVVVALMRGGLPLAEGIADTIPDAALDFVTDGAISERLRQCYATRPLILCDDAIHTGRSLEALLTAFLLPDSLPDRRSVPTPARLTVVVGIAGQEGLARLAERFPIVRFIVARVSAHSYVGQGLTDTGTRLFGL